MIDKEKSKKTKADKTRILVLFLFLIVLVAGIVFALFALKKRHEDQQYSAAQLTNAPKSIESIPGVTSASEEYTKIQHAENLAKAQTAAERAKVGSSAAVPTITRPAFVGNSSDFVAEQGGAPHPGCSPEEIKRAKTAGVTVSELRCKGCQVKDLQAFFTAAELKQAGFTAAELKAAGFSAEDLNEAGFSAAELMAAGYAPAQLKSAGYDTADLKEAGVSAADLEKLGVEADELRAAGFTPEELLKADFSAADLKVAGYSAKELKDAGASMHALSDAGFSPMDLVEAGATDEELTKANILPDKIKALRAELAEKEKLPKDCSIGALTKARMDNVSATALAKLKCDAAALKAAGFTAAQLRAAGFSAKDLKAAGFSAAELKAGGFNAAELKAAGFSAKDLKDAGFSAKELEGAGFSAQALKEAGFTAAELREAGFSPAQLRQAGYSADDLLKAGLSASDLRAAGYTVDQMKAAGLTPDQLKAAGFTDGELVRAGFAQEDISQPKVAAVATPAKEPGAPPSATEKNNPNLTTLAKTPTVDDLSDPEKVLERLRKRQADQISGEKQAEALQQIQASMTSQTTELIASWNPPPAQQYVAGEKDKTEGGRKEVSASGRRTSIEEETVSNSSNDNIIKAGTVMFAVLDTGVNSDEISPILATIVQGPFKGAKLLGQFTRTDQKVLLSFTTISLPQLPSSLTVNAVAIDPITARTAVSTSVNNHYLLRYGTLFASSFLTGFATAISQSGATTTIPPLSGNAIITQPALDTRDKVAVALGTVGSKYGDEMSKNFSRSPTVRVESGTALGILFMADLPVPTQVSVREEKFVQID